MYCWLTRVAVFLLSGSISTAETVTIHSGNGTVGNTDQAVHFLVGPATGNFGHAFSSTDFAAAQNGPFAFIVGRNPLWITGLSTDSSAQWIGTNASAATAQGNTALYAISFQIANPFSSATMALSWSADDGIGEAAGGGPNSGVYLNGTAVCGNSFAIGFTTEHAVTCNDIGSTIRTGTNWLYIENGNAAGSAGLLFSATISTTATSSGSGAPTISAGGVVTIYSTSSAIEPGSWVSIYGSNLITGSAPATWNGNYPIMLGGTSVTIDGKPAYLSYTSPTLINLEAPDDTVRGPVNVIVTNANGSATSTVILGDQSPSFSLLGDGKHVAGIILRSDGTGAFGAGPNSYDIVGPAGNSFGYTTVPAKAGDTVVLFGVGFGPSKPAVPAGQPFSGIAAATDSVAITIDGATLAPSFAGMGSPGLFQFNLTIPPGLGSGDQSVVATVNGVSTQQNVVIALESLAQNPQPVIFSLSPASVTAGSGPLTLTIKGTDSSHRPASASMASHMQPRSSTTVNLRSRSPLRTSRTLELFQLSSPILRPAAESRFRLTSPSRLRTPPFLPHPRDCRLEARRLRDRS